MKALVIFGLLLFSVSFVRAQEAEPETTQQDPKAQEKLKSLRIAYISEKLGLTPEQSEKFWPVYREFALERSKLRGELRNARREINTDNPDPKKQQDLIDLGLKVKQKELDLEKDYSGRLLKVINAQQMLNLHNAEQEFRTMIINQLQQRRLIQQRKENFRDKNQLLRQRKE